MEKFQVIIFVHKTNLLLHAINVVSPTLAPLAIQSHDHGGGLARCAVRPCTGALVARDRTLDPLEKALRVLRLRMGSGLSIWEGVGLSLSAACMFHATKHHKIERWIPVIGIAHADASIGHALYGSRQRRTGW